MAQTAVENIIEKLREQIRKSAHNKLGTNRTGDYRFGLIKAIDFCKQTKEMEKQQIMDAANKLLYHSTGPSDTAAEQYYNETFKKD
jgi:replication-associated recombination protein RarA